VSGTAVTEIFVHGYDAAAALQVKLPLPGQVCAVKGLGGPGVIGSVGFS